MSIREYDKESVMHMWFLSFHYRFIDLSFVSDGRIFFCTAAIFEGETLPAWNHLQKGTKTI
jgi:hypothetical protein